MNFIFPRLTLAFNLTISLKIYSTEFSVKSLSHSSACISLRNNNHLELIIFLSSTKVYHKKFSKYI